MEVSRVVLPAMREAHAGHVINLSSLAGVRGSAFSSIYCASKFAVEGFSEALAEELAPFGIRVTIVAPGPFRTDFLSTRSLRLGAGALAAYDPARDRIRASFEARNGRQAGDPARLAHAMITLVNDPQAPLRFVAGTAACHAALQKLDRMRADIASWRALSTGTDGTYADSLQWQAPAQA